MVYKAINTTIKSKTFLDVFICKKYWHLAFFNFRCVDVGDFLEAFIPLPSFSRLDESEKLDILKSFTLSLCQVSKVETKFGEKFGCKMFLEFFFPSLKIILLSEKNKQINCFAMARLRLILHTARQIIKN